MSLPRHTATVHSSKASTPSTKASGPAIRPDGLPDTAAGHITAKLRKALPAATETYVAYGACEVLVKECARQADYEVPERKQKDTPISRTEDGQDLGVGKGWWYECMYCLCAGVISKCVLE